jgi:hypothetical protein
LGKLVELVAGAAQRQTFLQALGLQAAGGRDDLRQRARDATGEDETAQGRQQQDGDAGQNHGAIEVADVVVERFLGGAQSENQRALGGGAAGQEDQVSGLIFELRRLVDRLGERR